MLQKALYEGIFCYHQGKGEKKAFIWTHQIMEGEYFALGIEEIKNPYVRGMVLPLNWT